MKTKLTEADYEEIREAYYAGESKEDIAKRKNISKYYVDSIINGQKGVVHHYTNTKREPAGRITFEMIAETRNNLRIGDRLLITLIEEKNGYTKKRTRRCRVTGKYRRVFTVQPGPCVMSFKYVDLLIGDGVEYDKKRKSV